MHVHLIIRKETMSTLATFIAVSTIITIAVVIVLWIVSTQQRLAVLDDNISESMSQIEAQLESRFDALKTLLNLTTGYARHESDVLMETIKSGSNAITAAESTPSDVMRQEGMITEALGRIALVAEQYPELKASQTYTQTMGTVETFENMVHISRLIYNDSVTKLNREIRIFPVSMVAGMLGFQQRAHLEE